MKTPWEILGLSQNANDQEINKAFKKAIFANHPDRFQDPVKKKEAQRKSKELNQALKDIKDFKEKGFYGSQQDHFKDPFSQWNSFNQEFTGDNPFNFFNDIFNQFSRKEYSTQYEVSLFQLLQGHHKIKLKLSNGQNLEIEIPSWVEHNQVLGFDFQEGSVKAKISVTVKIKEESKFFKVKNDLYSVCEIDKNNLSNILVKHPIESDSIQLKLDEIPSFGSHHIIKNKGFLKRDNKRGDWIVIFNNDPNPDSRNILRNHLKLKTKN